MALVQRPPATRSQTRRMGPAADRATVPEGNMRTCSTGTVFRVLAELEESPMVISQAPVLESKRRTVASYEPVRMRWGLEVETCPERT